MSPATILTVNSGSSSIRLDLFSVGEDVHRLDGMRLSPAPDANGGVVDDLLQRNGMSAIHAVVHRVVHGGQALTATCRIDASIEDEIERLAPLAPLHNPVALAWSRALRTALGRDVTHIAAFDTAFFSDLPQQAATYALPWELCARHGIRRYGFHGLAHRAMWEFWYGRGQAAASRRRAITVQLGAGCSVTATQDGRPVDTSMGFSPLEGLVMSTRGGDLDPGIVLYLLRDGGLTLESLESVLNDRAGLLGISGLSGDMRRLLESDDVRAKLAVSVFCHRVRKYVGAYLAVLGGADVILFGGGIGEHAPAVRAHILKEFEWAGISLDLEANARARGGQASTIHSDDSTAAVWVVPVDEASVLAQEALSVLPGLDLQGRQHEEAHLFESPGGAT